MIKKTPILEIDHLCVPDPNLRYLTNYTHKMSVVDLDRLSNDDLKKNVASLISLEDWADECGACGCPALLHRDSPSTRWE